MLHVAKIKYFFNFLRYIGPSFVTRLEKNNCYSKSITKPVCTAIMLTKVGLKIISYGPFPKYKNKVDAGVASVVTTPH